jgi:DNA-binding NarL/FixJ family response regulator
MAADAGSRCAARETLLASTVAKRLIENCVRRPPPSDGRDVPDALKRLTPRELDVVRAVAHGTTPLNQAAPTFNGKGCIGMRHR